MKINTFQKLETMHVCLINDSNDCPEWFKHLTMFPLSELLRVTKYVGSPSYSMCNLGCSLVGVHCVSRHPKEGKSADTHWCIFGHVNSMALGMVGQSACQSLGPPLWFRLKCLNNHLMACYEILYRHIPEGKSYWLLSFSDSSSSATTRLTFVLQGEISWQLTNGLADTQLHSL